MALGELGSIGIILQIEGVDAFIASTQSASNKAIAIAEKEALKREQMYKQMFDKIRQQEEKQSANEAKEAAKQTANKEKELTKQSANEAKALAKQTSDDAKAKLKQAEQKQAYVDANKKFDEKITADNKKELDKQTAQNKSALQKQAEQKQAYESANAKWSSNLLKQQSAEREAFNKSFASGVVNNMTHMGQMGRMMTRMVASSLLFGGGAFVATSAHHLMQVQELAAKVSISSDNPARPGQKISSAEALATAHEITATTGIDEKEVLEGMRTFTKKASMGKSGMDMMKFLSKISMAESVDIGELSNAMGTMMAQNPNMTKDEQQSFVRMVVGQGKRGSMELEDLAKVLPTVTGQAALFGNQFVAQSMLATVVQDAAKTTNDPGMAAVAVKRFVQDLEKVKKHDKFKNLRNSDGTLKDLGYVIGTLLDESKGDPTKLIASTGARGFSLLESYLPAYKEAEAKQKGSGGYAITQQIQKMATEGQISQADIDKHAAEQLALPGKQLEMAFQHLRDSMENELAPVLVKFAHQLEAVMPKLEKLIPVIGTLIGKFLDFTQALLDNPFKTFIEAASVAFGLALTKAILMVAAKKAAVSAVSAILNYASGVGPTAVVASGIGAGATEGVAGVGGLLGAGGFGAGAAFAGAMGAGMMAGGGLGMYLGYLLTENQREKNDAREEEQRLKYVGKSKITSDLQSQANVATDEYKLAQILDVDDPNKIEYARQKALNANEKARGKQVTDFGSPFDSPVFDDYNFTKKGAPQAIDVPYNYLMDKQVTDPLNAAYSNFNGGNAGEDTSLKGKVLDTFTGKDAEDKAKAESAAHNEQIQRLAALKSAYDDVTTNTYRQSKAAWDAAKNLSNIKIPDGLNGTPGKTGTGT